MPFKGQVTEQTTVKWSILALKNLLFVLPTGADTKYCHFCAEQNEATCLAKQQNQTCATDRNSLGTAHCTSAVVRYRNQFGNTTEVFFRGCVDCSSR